MKLTHKLLVLASVAAGFGVAPALAQDNRTITIVVPFAAGGPVDAAARVLAPLLSTRLGQPVIVDNKPGGNAVIAAQAVLNAPADGHTLYLQTVATVSPVFIKDLKMAVTRDMEPVAPIWTISYFLFVNSNVPAKNIKEFTDYAKKNPGKLNYGYGTASSMLAMETLKTTAGLDVLGVPYRGSAPASLAMLSNEVQATFDLPGVYKQYLDSGKMRPLLYTGKSRSAALPDVPTASEIGIPELEISLAGGFWTRAGAPRNVIDRIGAATSEIISSPAVRDRFTAIGWSVFKGTSADLMQAVNQELQFWDKAAKVAKYVPQ